MDALGEEVDNNMGIEHRATLEKRMQCLEQGITKKISGTGKQKAKFDKYTVKREAPKEEAVEAMQDDESTIPTFKKRKY